MNITELILGHCTFRKLLLLPNLSQTCVQLQPYMDCNPQFRELGAYDVLQGTACQ